LLDLARVDVVDMLEQLGVEVVRHESDEVVYRCPFPGHMYGDAHPSTSMQQGTTMFHCWGCNRSGNAITFVSMLEGVSPMRAARWLREQYGSDFREPQGSIWDEIRGILSSKDAVSQEDPCELPREFVDQRLIDWDKASKLVPQDHPFRVPLDKLEPATLDSWEVGWDSASCRVSIPVHDLAGRLVGFKGRAVLPDQHPKYLVLGNTRTRGGYGFEPYPVSTVVFGLNRLVGDRAVVCEGEFDAMAVGEAGIDGGVAVGGSSFSTRQLSLIRDTARSAVVLFDPDDAGSIGALKVAAQLEPFMPVAVVEGHSGDPCEMPPQELAAAVDSAISPLRRRLVSMTP